MEQRTEIKSTSPAVSIVDSARNSTSASVQHEHVAQPHSRSQPPGIAGRYPLPVVPKQQWDKSPHEDTKQSLSAHKRSMLLASSAPGLSMLATVMQGQPKAVIDHTFSGGQQCPSRSKSVKKQQHKTKCTSALPVPPMPRPCSYPAWGRKLSPNRSLLVSTAHSDHDEGSRSGTEVDLSRCHTVQQFVERYSTALPVDVIAIQDELQRRYTIHCIEQRTVLRIEDKNFCNSFNVPIESKVKIGIVYNPCGNDREAYYGYTFATVSDILKLSHFPAVVVVTKNFSDHHCGSPPVKKHEVLIVREASTQRLSGQRYLRVYSLLTNSTKDLPEQCAGHFSTSPSLVSMYVADIIHYVFPHPFPCQAVMYIPPDNQDTQIPCKISNVITISDSRIEKSLVASEVSNSASTSIRIPFDCSSKILILPEATNFEECTHPLSGEVVYAQPKKKTSVATGEYDYEIKKSCPLTESTYSERDTRTTLQNSNKPAKKKQNPLSAFVQRTLRRRNSTKKSKSAPRPATNRDSAIVMTDNSSYMTTRATTWPRQPRETSSTSVGNVGPTFFSNVCYLTTDTSGSDCDHYEPIPGDTSLESTNTIKETCVPYEASSTSIGNVSPTIFPNGTTGTSGSDCEHYEPIPGDASLQPANTTYIPHETSIENGNPTIFPNRTPDTSCSKCDHYEPLPGGASLQPANTTKETFVPVHHSQPEPYIEPTEFLQAIPNVKDGEYESMLDLEICNSNGNESETTNEDELTCRPITPSSTYTQASYETPQRSSNSEPSVISAKTAVNQHVIAKIIEEQLNYHREEILGWIQVLDDQLKHHREESLRWMQEHEGRLGQLQQPQETVSNSESKLPGISDYLASRADFVTEDTNMQKIQSMFEHLTSQVDASYGEFRNRLDSFEQQLGQQQNLAYEYIASQSCNRLQSDDTTSEVMSQSQGQDLQKVHSMLEHLTVVTAQTGESMSESYVQFTKRLDSIEQQLEQQKGVYEQYHPDCRSKETKLEPSLCTVHVQDNTSAASPNETSPLNQPQVVQWIDIMTELHKKLEKRLMEQMESFEQKLTEQQILMHCSLKQLAKQQSPAYCHTPQAVNQGSQSAKPEPQLKEVACILNGFCQLYELGVQLDISVAALDQLDHDHGSNIGKYRIKVIEHWLKNTETPTWEVLAQALKDIGEDGLARRILAKYG